jgi:hypothetical protein
VEKLWVLVSSAMQAALGKYGPGIVLLILAIGFLFWLLYRSYDARLKEKDEEIKRIVIERDKLQRMVVKKRLTTQRRRGDKN